MSRLDEYKSELVQTSTCELTLLKKGHLKCAKEIMKYRRDAMSRAWMLGCLLDEDDYDTDMANSLMEDIKELVRMIVVNRCIQSYC